VRGAGATPLGLGPQSHRPARGRAQALGVETLGGSTTPVRDSAIRLATSGWSRLKGTAAIGTPAATALVHDAHPRVADGGNGVLEHQAVRDEALEARVGAWGRSAALS
jgi:hypothetical protein